MIDALRCAMAIQRGMQQRNADVPKDRRISYRIGVHLGDMVVNCGGLDGEAGVVIATRLRAGDSRWNRGIGRGTCAGR